MRIKNMVIICTLFLFVLSFTAAAQPFFQANANFMIGNPQGEFKDNIENNGFGFNGHFLYQLPASYFNVGLSISYLIYGSETREEPWSQTIPDVKVDVTTTNSIFYSHLLLRIQPPTGIVRPYIDGLFGFGHFSTNTSVEDQEYDDDHEIASTNHASDTALNYGFGGGTMIRVWDAKQYTEDHIGEVSVDLGVRYLKGGEAEYLKENSIQINDGNLSYQKLRSKTDILTYHIGVTFNFSIKRPDY